MVRIVVHYFGLPLANYGLLWGIVAHSLGVRPINYVLLWGIYYDITQDNTI